VATQLSAWSLLEALGERYIEETLKNNIEYRYKTLASDWWGSLNFFWGHAFMRGRSDKLSGKYMRHTRSVLRELGKRTNNLSWQQFYRAVNSSGNLEDDTRIIRELKKDVGLTNLLSMKANKEVKYAFEKIRNRNELIKRLTTRPGENEPYLNNDKDLLMVLEALQYTEERCDGNIYEHIVNSISNTDIDMTVSASLNETYKDICGIYGCADKIATFYLRDIALLNSDFLGRINADLKPPYEAWKKLFPVDTWVEQVADNLGYKKPRKGSSPETLKEFCISRCHDGGVCPAKVNAGFWYIGAKGFDLLMQLVNTDNVVLRNSLREAFEPMREKE